MVAAAQLRVDGATPAVDSVLTDPDARGRGYADAVLAAALVRPARLRGARLGLMARPAVIQTGASTDRSR